MFYCTNLFVGAIMLYTMYPYGSIDVTVRGTSRVIPSRRETVYGRMSGAALNNPPSDRVELTIRPKDGVSSDRLAESERGSIRRGLSFRAATTLLSSIINGVIWNSCRRQRRLGLAGTICAAIACITAVGTAQANDGDGLLIQRYNEGRQIDCARRWRDHLHDPGISMIGCMGFDVATPDAARAQLIADAEFATTRVATGPSGETRIELGVHFYRNGKLSVPSARSFAASTRILASASAPSRS